MDDVDQLHAILSQSDFWELDDCRSYRLNGGILVEMTGESGGCGWKVTWMNRPESKSDKKFRNWKDAKVDLHAYLTGQREDLADDASPPAKCE